MALTQRLALQILLEIQAEGRPVMVQIFFTMEFPEVAKATLSVKFVPMNR